jgi:hypothetical protein
MNLFLALFWLLLGVTVFVLQTFFGETRWYIPGNFRISYGWVMLLLVLFNLKRWWNMRAAQRERRRLQLELAEQRRDTRRAEGRDSPEPPNPAFNFTEPAPPQTDLTERLEPPG